MRLLRSQCPTGAIFCSACSKMRRGIRLAGNLEVGHWSCALQYFLELRSRNDTARPRPEPRSVCGVKGSGHTARDGSGGQARAVDHHPNAMLASAYFSGVLTEPTFSIASAAVFGSRVAGVFKGANRPASASGSPRRRASSARRSAAWICAIAVSLLATFIPHFLAHTILLPYSPSQWSRRMADEIDSC